jgi:oxygen-independent coproporphyrinogen-3 oxidase
MLEQNLTAHTDKSDKVVPLSLYIHLPWCVRKCPYCDFNSHALKSELPEARYIDALLEDVQHDVPRVGDRPIESIFIGGGTPSLFSAESIDRLLQGLQSRLTFSPDSEITLEANPGTVEQRKFQEFRELGINRLSLGIQSFNADHLQRLGRIHGREEAFRAAEVAHEVGFDNFNLDIMFGLPTQSLDQALRDVANAIALEPTHISYYQLTVEPNTLFHRYLPSDLPDDEKLWKIQQQGQQRLQEAGFEHYEVSAFARSQRRCRHNVNYWEFGDYLGIGAGAHGKLTDSAGDISRYWKLKNPQDYMIHAGRPSCTGGDSEIRSQDLPLEFMMNALRLVAGFPVVLFETRTGLSAERLLPALRKASEQDLLTWQGEWVQPTARGWRFLNDLLTFFMPEGD